MRPFIKICGISKSEDAKFAEECGADAVGFIGYPKSPRYVSPTQTEKIISSLGPQIRKIAVLVNPSQEQIRLYASAGTDAIQLHGDEPPEILSTFPPSLKCWKAIRPETENDVMAFASFPAEFIVFETCIKGQYGGTGIKADWKLAKFAVSKLSRPVILAGGIRRENLKEAIQTVHPFGLDINSSIEDAPGIKNHARIKEIFVELENILANKGMDI